MMNIEDVLPCSDGVHGLQSLDEYITSLQKCRKMRNPSYGNQVYMHLCHHGLEAHKELGNYLVPMFVECGSLCHALQLFRKLVHRNEFSWSSLVQGCVESGKFEHAFALFQKMQDDHIHPSKFTFIALLKACAIMVSKERGWKLHSVIAQEAYERDPFVGSALVDMYANCESLAEAEDVFDELSLRDVVLWNSLIAAYADCGSAKEALKCLEQMQLEGVTPDAITYLCCLKACRSIDKVRELYTEVVKEDYEKEAFIGNTLVGLYAKLGSLPEAWEVCEELTARDVVSWNLLMAGFIEHGLGKEALKHLEQMQQEAVSPDSVTYIYGLKACISIGAIDKGQDLHAEIIIQGFERDSFLANTLVDMYAKFGALAEAKEIFHEMPVQSVVSWTALIGGFVEHGLYEKALSCFGVMQLEDASPNASTLICGLKACGSAGVLDMGRQIHGEIMRKGYEGDAFVGNALVDMYARCASLAEAQRVFDGLSTQDVVSWTSLITAYVEHRLAREALDCLKCMQLEGVSPDTVSWNAVIFCYGEQGESEKPLELYAQMQEQGLLPDIATFVSILYVCSNTAALKSGKRIHVQLYRFGQAEMIEGNLATALVDMYSKCGSMVQAQQVFDAMLTRNIVAWNALIAGYVRQGESEFVFQLFDRLIEEGIKPDETVFLSVLTVCNHVGLVDRGRQYFESMIKEYGIFPTNKHYNCILDLLGRAGQLNEAGIMLGNVPLQPDVSTWSTLLGACQKWGNVELGKQAFEFAEGLDEIPAAAFILMSNLYADAKA